MIRLLTSLITLILVAVSTLLVVAGPAGEALTEGQLRQARGGDLDSAKCTD